MSDEKECYACGGTGEVNQVSRVFHRQRGFLTEQTSKMVRCEECNGTGKQASGEAGT